jgi:Tol biopolymer transport system component
MSLVPGVRVGPYEILAFVGAGGMGEVYRARDARLGRDVAIKLLPAALSDDPDRLRRFEQEARAAAALNHSNILAVHDIGTQDGAPYIVSELLEGETLRERLHSGPVPMRKTIDYAIQIARGLAAAHDRGIVHRDLKPENIFICSDGAVKILDFGLAKLTQADGRSGGASAVATAAPDTLPGVVVGTVEYMAPEQVRGQSTDHRADIFSFGTILYELLASHRPFRGDTAADVMSAVLRQEAPDLPVAERHIPPALVRIVDRCLQKSPAARFQSAGDLAFALEALSAHSGTTDALKAASTPARRPQRLPWAVAALLAVALIAAAAVAAALYRRDRPQDARVLRFSVLPPEGWTLAISTSDIGSPVSALPLSVSPDGRRLAFVARDQKGTMALWVRALDALAPMALAGTEGATSPFWSPDSRTVGFFADRKLKRIDASGGPALTLCDAPGGAGGTWNAEGTIVFAATQRPLHKVSAAGGVPAVAVPFATNESAHMRPHFLPDGRHVIYRTQRAGEGSPVLMMAALESDARTRLVESDSTNAVYSQGHLLFLRGKTLMAMPFDPAQPTVHGDTIPVAEKIQTIGSPSSGVFSASPNGVLAYHTGSASIESELAWIDRTGKVLAKVGDRATYSDVELSPDGHRLLASIIDPVQSSRDVWIVDLARGLRSRLTFDRAEDYGAIWSPDGGRVLFASDRAGQTDLYMKSSNGVGAEEAVFTGPPNKLPLTWSPDGQSVLYGASADILKLPMSGERKPTPFFQTPFPEAMAQYSPDGRWVAYVSGESGRTEVYVAPSQGTAGKWMVSSQGGILPRWRRDSRELFYYAPQDSRLMAAVVHGTDKGFDVGAIQPLFGVRGGTRKFYDVAADGRLLVNVAAELQSAPTEITVVVNWTPAPRN